MPRRIVDDEMGADKLAGVASTTTLAAPLAVSLMKVPPQQRNNGSRDVLERPQPAEKVQRLAAPCGTPNLASCANGGPQRPRDVGRVALEGPEGGARPVDDIIKRQPPAVRDDDGHRAMV